MKKIFTILFFTVFLFGGIQSVKGQTDLPDAGRYTTEAAITSAGSKTITAWLKAGSTGSTNVGYYGSKAHFSDLRTFSNASSCSEGADFNITINKVINWSSMGYPVHIWGLTNPPSSTGNVTVTLIETVTVKSATATSISTTKDLTSYTHILISATISSSGYYGSVSSISCTPKTSGGSGGTDPAITYVGTAKSGGSYTPGTNKTGTTNVTTAYIGYGGSSIGYNASVYNFSNTSSGCTNAKLTIKLSKNLSQSGRIQVFPTNTTYTASSTSLHIKNNVLGQTEDVSTGNEFSIDIGDITSISQIAIKHTSISTLTCYITSVTLECVSVPRPECISSSSFSPADNGYFISDKGGDAQGTLSWGTKPATVDKYYLYVCNSGATGCLTNVQTEVVGIRTTKTNTLATILVPTGSSHIYWKVVPLNSSEQTPAATCSYLTANVIDITTSCASGSLTLSSHSEVGTCSYQWQSSSSQTGTYADVSGAKNNTFSPSYNNIGTWYRCKVTNSNGYGTSSCVQATAACVCQSGDEPAISTHPVAPSSFCEGTSGQSLSVTASGSGTLSYQWQKSVSGADSYSNISGATSASYTIPTTEVAGTYDYKCKVSNNCGEATSNPATVTVIAAPAAVTVVSDGDVCTGGSISISASGGTGGIIYYQGTTSGGTSTATASTSQSISTGGTYYFRAYNSTGGCWGAQGSVTVNELTPVSITTHPQDATVLQNAELTLSVTAAGSEPLSYQWYKDNSEIEDATSATYTVNTASAAGSGAYKVEVTNSCGDLLSDVATVTINIPPACPTNLSYAISTGKLTWTGSTGATSYDVYLGTSSTLETATTNVETTEYTPVDLTPGTKYYWKVVATDGTLYSSGCSAEEFISAPECSSSLAYNSTTGAFSWADNNSSEISYNVYLSTASDFATAEIVAATAKTVNISAFTSTTLQSGTVYYWKVVPKIGTTEYTGCTAPSSSFKTAIACPTNLLPADEATNVATNSSLTWTGSTGATTYDVYFGTSSTFETATTNVGTTSYTPTLSSGTKYYWKVLATDGTLTSDGCSVMEFTTAPQCPSAHAYDSELGTLSWTAANGAAVSYQVYLSANSDLSGAITKTASSTSIALSDFESDITFAPGTTYYWKVVTFVGSTEYTDCTVETQSFVTTPACSTTPSITDAAILGSVPTSLGWSTTNSSAVSFKVYLSTTSDFSETTTETETTTTTSIDIADITSTSLNPGTTYYWKAIPMVGTTESSSCTGYWSFTLEPECVSMPAPANTTAVDVPVPVKLAWASSNGAATTYDIYIEEDDTPLSTARATGVSGYEVLVSQLITLDLGKTYNWKVVPKIGSTEYSACVQEWSFTTSATIGIPIFHNHGSDDYQVVFDHAAVGCNPLVFRVSNSNTVSSFTLEIYDTHDIIDGTTIPVFEETFIGAVAGEEGTDLVCDLSEVAEYVPGVYFARVKAAVGGIDTEWSRLHTFTYKTTNKMRWYQSIKHQFENSCDFNIDAGTCGVFETDEHFLALNENIDNGRVGTSTIHLASFKTATDWELLKWRQELNEGTISMSINGVLIDEGRIKDISSEGDKTYMEANITDLNLGASVSITIAFERKSSGGKSKGDNPSPIVYDLEVSANDIPLPVTWLVFAGVCNNNNTKLTWSTASELNADYFVVQRSFDLVNFEDAGRVNASGNSVSRIDYQFVDNNNMSAYYRLKQVDFDGKYDYSNLIYVNCDIQSNAKLEVFPNPFDGKNIFVQSDMDIAKAVVQISDISGRVIVEKSLGNILGSELMTISINKELQPGNYYLTIKSNISGIVITKKIVVVK